MLKVDAWTRHGGAAEHSQLGYCPPGVEKGGGGRTHRTAVRWLECPVLAKQPPAAPAVCRPASHDFPHAARLLSGKWTYLMAQSRGSACLPSEIVVSMKGGDPISRCSEASAGLHGRSDSWMMRCQAVTRAFESPRRAGTSFRTLAWTSTSTERKELTT